MKRNLYVGRVLLALVALLTSSTALALANRVFVSQRSGNDANSCDNILTPCQTFAGAVLQLNPGGEAIVLDSGGYGPVTITQSVIIEAPPGVLAFIHPPSGGDAVTVNASGATVVLRGLTIDGAGQATGYGIKVAAVAVLHVENCVITGFAGSISGGTGMVFFSAGALFVKDTVIRGNGNGGIFVAPPAGTAQASLDHCRLEDNGNFGFASDANTKATIKDSVASGNGNGLETDNGGELNAEGCLIANNGVGLESVNSAVVRASNCTITDNTTGLVSISGGALFSRSNNTFEGNGTPGAFTGFYPAH